MTRQRGLQRRKDRNALWAQRQQRTAKTCNVLSAGRRPEAARAMLLRGEYANSAQAERVCIFDVDVSDQQSCIGLPSPYMLLLLLQKDQRMQMRGSAESLTAVVLSISASTMRHAHPRNVAQDAWLLRAGCTGWWVPSAFGCGLTTAVGGSSRSP